MSASLAGVSGWRLMRWPSQLKRRLCVDVLHYSVLVYNVGDNLVSSIPVTIISSKL